MGANIDGIPLGNRSPPRNQPANSSGNGPEPEGGVSLENQNQHYKNTGGGQNSFQQMQQEASFKRRKNFFENKRNLNYPAYNPIDIQNQY
mmetsp:Transcript_41365/g.63048  ORF Transcript_41365/g.63048 Transcript_41365/m.63048 type:complete len:90 (-) Transcript_41365:784-1053(-)